jgi:hypothetical protein
MDSTTSKKLYDHVFDTYISLRVGTACIAFAFPIVVRSARCPIGLLGSGRIPPCDTRVASVTAASAPQKGGYFHLSRNCHYSYRSAGASNGSIRAHF